MIDFRGRARALACLLCLILGLGGRAAQAQSRERSGKNSHASKAPPPAPAPAVVEAPVDPTVALGDAAMGASRYGIILPAEKIDDLKGHWERRLSYLRDRDERRADDEEQLIRQIKDELAIDDLFAIGADLVRESDEALAAGAGALARKRCELAITLAPGLAAGHLCLSRAILAEDIFSVRDASRSMIAAARAAARDARASHAITANVGAVVLAGFLLAGAAFALLLFSRYAKLYFHDVHHLFPNGARRWQTALLGVALVLSPLLLQVGPVPMLFTMLAAVALYATTLEVMIGALSLLMLAIAPFAVEQLARSASYAGPAADIWLIERGEGTAAGLARLQLRLDQPNLEFPVAYALARRAKREGDLVTAKALYQRALHANGVPTDSLAATHNNLGNVELLFGDADKARAQYTQALELRESLAPAHFNMSRALALGGVDQLEQVQAEQARALDLDRPDIEAFTGGTLQANRKANKFLMDVHLPSASLANLREQEAQRAVPVGDEARSLLGGFPSPELAVVPPIAGVLLLLLLFALRGRVKPAGRCERCGREVCKRCDADARPREALCAQCVNVYIRRNSVEPAERTRKEEAVALYRRRRALLLRLASLLSGASHVLMGHPLVGILFLSLTGLLAASIALGAGIVHQPNTVRAGASILRISITAALFCIVYGLCLRDFLARQRAES